MGNVNFTQIPPLAKKTVFNYQPLGKEKTFFNPNECGNIYINQAPSWQILSSGKFGQ